MNSRAWSDGTGADVRVLTRCGPLVGRSRGAVSSFKGIPYAAAPTGPLRWRPPVGPASWDGERPAFDYGPAPIQEQPSKSSLMYRLNFDDRNALVMSEDCLYLNVWTPSPSPTANLPVLFWIHGGGNRCGHGGQELHDGSRLAARGVVVVSVNMRLGALGFLSLPTLNAEDPLGASGNYGLQDLEAALGWVQENIAAFGGDTSAVTLVGASAGSAHVTHLMAAPSSRGLFRAAVGQSASGVFRPEGPMISQDQAAHEGAEMLGHLGSVPLQQLRELPATAFLKFAPQNVIIDGRMLLGDTTTVFLEGRQAAVPLMVGTNADEGSVFASAATAAALRPSSLDDAASRVFVDTYPQPSDEAGGDGARALIGDRRFVHPVWRWARTHAQTTTAPTWRYRFEHRLPVPTDVSAPPDGGFDYGTFHSAELPYTGDNLTVRSWEWTATDAAVAKCIADTWVRFAATADPNGGSELPAWKCVNQTGTTPTMVLGPVPHMDMVQDCPVFEIFDNLYFNRSA